MPTEVQENNDCIQSALDVSHALNMSLFGTHIARLCGQRGLSLWMPGTIRLAFGTVAAMRDMVHPALCHAERGCHQPSYAGL